jgi:hypothetical protein
MNILPVLLFKRDALKDSYSNIIDKLIYTKRQFIIKISKRS